MDGRFQAAVDGRLPFEPSDYDDLVLSGRESTSLSSWARPGQWPRPTEIRAFRDIYYTSVLANTPRQARGARRGEAARRRALYAGQYKVR